MRFPPRLPSAMGAGSGGLLYELERVVMYGRGGGYRVKWSVVSGQWSVDRVSRIISQIINLPSEYWS